MPDRLDSAPPNSAPPDSPPIVSRDCPACAAPQARATDLGVAPPEWPLLRCRECGFVYLGRAPDYGALAEEFAWEKTADAEGARRDAERPVTRLLSRATRLRMRLLPRKQMPDLVRRFAAPGRVLDLGCGDGGQLAGLDGAYQPIGIEVSAAIAARPNAEFAARGGIIVNAPSLPGLQRFPDGHFTAVTLRSYLEHELRPKEVLAEVFRVLAPGGVAIVKVPHYGSINRRLGGPAWCGYRFPDHCNYFTPDSLRRMANAIGFSIRFGLTYRLPTSDNFWALLRKPPHAL